MTHKPTFTPHQHKTSLIQIYSYDNKNPCGIIQNTYYSQAKAFSNLTQLLLLMEQIQDELQYPQKGMELRRFKMESSPAETEPSLKPRKPLATFKVQILFRQNASWQGNVIWVERGLASPFRSALELVGLVDSILS